MALAFADRVKETTTTTGTGTITLAGASAGYQSFAAIGNGNTTYYTISMGTQWEVGVGTYTAAGTTLSRDVVLASSNGGALVNFSAGTKDVFCDYPAGKAVIQDAGGNVGIGTATPTAKLDVNGLVNTGYITVRGDGSEGGQITFNNSANTFGPLTLDVDVGGNGRLFTAVNNASLTLGQLVGTGGVVTLFTSGLERMRVTAAGLVGIGTSAPSFLLHGVQNGNAEFRVSATNVGTNSAGLTVENEGNRNWNLWANRSTDNFIIGANSRGTEFFAINGSSANVGIGTSSPAVRLDIRGGDLQVSRGASGVAADAAINFGNGTSNYIFGGNANNVMAFATNGSERMRITSGGDVGVGTSIPQHRLQVETAANVGGTFGVVANSNGVYPPGIFGLSVGYNFTAGGAEVDFWNGWTGAAGTQGGFAFRRQTGASSQNLLMLIRGDGNVGIGTDSPNNRLTVVGGSVAQYKASGDNNAFYGSTSDTSNNYLRLQNSVNTVDVTCSNGSAYLNSAQNVLWFGTNGGERMRLAGSELLIGTTTGGRTVCIYSSDNWMRMHNPNRAWLIGLSNGSNFNIYDETGGYNVASFDTAGSFNLRNSMYIGSGQNLDNKIEVGSGRTGNNYAYIDLIGDTTYTDYGLRLLRGNSGPNTTSQLVHRGTGGMYITAQDAAPILFQTSSATRFYVEATGSVVYNSLLVGRNSGSTDVNSANDTGSISIRGSTTTVAVMSFHRAGAYAMNVGLGLDAVFRMGGWSMSSNCFQMDGSGNLTMLGNVTAYSDARIKKDVETIDDALGLVRRMRGVRFTRTDTEKRGIGVIAQEMLEVIPEVVQQGMGEDTTLSVAYGNLVGVLIEAIKELEARVAGLEGK